MTLRSERLGALARLFLRLGAIGFGGPQAHIAMASDEVVERRRWLSADEFGDGLAICEMLPGPASTQMGIYIGYAYGGWPGALVAGLCFIAPAFCIVVALSWIYFQFQQLPQLVALFFGLSPVMVAIVVGFCYRLGRKSLVDWRTSAIAILVFCLSALTSVSTLAIFVAAGVVGLICYGPRGTRVQNLVPVGLLAAATPGGWGQDRMAEYGWPLFLFFLKVGAFIFGGGLVIIPLLEFELVERLGWLTTADFINGVAIGQLSPGPVVLTAAFVGFKMAGLLGALTATVGIFTPSFLFIMLAAPLLLKLRQNDWVKAFLKGIRPAVVGAIAAATLPLGRSALGQPTLLLSLTALVLGAVSLTAIIRLRVAAWKPMVVGALVGLVAYPLLG